MSDNTEFLARIHALNAEMTELTDLMTAMVTLAASAEIDTIPVPTLMLAKVTAVMNVQQTITRGLVEENAMIMDHVNKLLAKYSV